MVKGWGCLGFSSVCNVSPPAPTHPPSIWYPSTFIMPKLPSPDVPVSGLSTLDWDCSSLPFSPCHNSARDRLCPVPTVLKPCCASESLRVFVKIPGHLSCVSELGNLHFNQQAPTLGESDLVRRWHFEQPCATHLRGGGGVSFSSAHPPPAVPGPTSNKSLNCQCFSFLL